MEQMIRILATAFWEGQRKYHRAKLLAAYKSRKRWKAADVKNLQSLNINAVARRRILRLTSRPTKNSRPVVKLYEPMIKQLVSKVNQFQMLFDPSCSELQRKQAFRESYWMPYFVEALYRGEYARAKQGGMSDAARQAEEIVVKELGMSVPLIHKHCGDVRRMRKQAPDEAIFPPMSLADYQNWMKTGIAPDWLETDN